MSRNALNWCFILFITLLLSSRPTTAQPALELVRDINVNTLNQGRDCAITYNGKLFFAAKDGVHGCEPWVSDGTASGTSIFRDFNTGAGSSDPNNMAIVGGKLYFNTNSRLIETDGTFEGTKGIFSGSARIINAGGTTVVADYDVRRYDGYYSDVIPGVESLGLNAIGNMLYFLKLIRDPSGYGYNYALFKSGLNGGPTKVKDLVPYPLYLDKALEINGRLYYLIRNSLLFSDGTTEGTYFGQIENIAQSPFILLRLDSKLFLMTTTDSSRVQLTMVNWDLKGTPTVVHPDATEGQMAVLGRQLIFAAGDTTHGTELWTAQSTGKTHMIRDLVPGRADSNPHNLTPCRNVLYFSTHSSEGDCALWKTNGAFSGTIMVKDYAGMSMRIQSVFSGPGDTAFFTTTHPIKGWSLWKSDGTAAGTIELKTILDRSPGSSPQFVSATDKKAFMLATDEAHGREFWTTDGTVEGTMLLKDFRAGPYDSMDPGILPRHFLTFGHHAFFPAGGKLWRSDGTPEGTVALGDPSAAWDSFVNMTELGGQAFFHYAGGFITADTMTTSLTSITGSNFSPSMTSPKSGAVVGSHYLFLADESNWDASRVSFGRTDGTDGGTLRIRGFWPTANGSCYEYSPMHLIGNKAYFFLHYSIPTTGGNRRRELQLWQSAGTYISTAPAAVIRCGRPGEPIAYGFTKAQTKIFFTAQDEQHGCELWFSGGTTATAHMVRDIAPGAASMTLGDNIEIAGKLFFAADDGIHGSELWVSDGTTSGTRMIRDLNPGDAGARPVIAGILGNDLIIAADDGSHGTELWKVEWKNASDIVLVRDINPQAGSNPSNFFISGGQIFLSADDGDHGRELWRTDGSMAGTTMIGDINPGRPSSSPSSFFMLGRKLLFTADDGIHGAELWKMSETQAAARAIWHDYP